MKMILISTDEKRDFEGEVICSGTGEVVGLGFLSILSAPAALAVSL